MCVCYNVISVLCLCRLIDEVIENTIREKLLGMSIGDDGDESAIGSLGSGSIHHFSGEDMAEIMAPGSRYGDGSQDTSTGSSRLFVPRKHSAADGSPDSNSEEDVSDCLRLIKTG